MADSAPRTGVSTRRPASPETAWRGAPRTWLCTTVVFTTAALVTGVVLAPRASGPDRGLAWLLFVGSSVHVASTGWLFTLRDVRAYAASRPVRYQLVPAALVLATALAAALLTPSELAWLLLPFFAWQFFHFQKQNLGIVALAGSSQGLSPVGVAERRVIIAAGVAGIGALVTRPGLLQLKIDAPLSFFFPVAAIAFGLVALFGLVLLMRRPPVDRPAGYCATYFVALLFFAPVFLFTSPYAAVGGMTIAHGLQYLLLVGLIAAGGERGAKKASRLGALCNIALIGGLALAFASHLHGAAPAGRLLFGAYLGAVMTHFMVDAGIWRLRDPFPRAFLAGNVPYLVGRPCRLAVAAPSTDRSSPDIG